MSVILLTWLLQMLSALEHSGLTLETGPEFEQQVAAASLRQPKVQTATMTSAQVDNSMQPVDPASFDFQSLAKDYSNGASGKFIWANQPLHRRESASERLQTPRKWKLSVVQDNRRRLPIDPERRMFVITVELPLG